ncbi:MAG: hypothetical protein LBB89_01830 [Treponema sp.]|jgi:hypothetical protein|nr:hypothetical protein [Treponema sp.]
MGEPLIRSFDDFDQLLQRIDTARNPYLFDTNLKYGLFLRHILLKGTHDETLYVSVGEAEWVYGFLSRLLQETTSEDNKPKFSKLAILHLSKEAAERFEKEKRLSVNFYGRMNGNIEGLKKLSSVNKIKFCSILCEDIPNFHGYMFGNWVLKGEWKRDNSGTYGVRTSLEAFNRNKNEWDFELFNKMFDRNKINWISNNA